MNYEQFKKYIESIGFKHNDRLFKYKEYRIDLYRYSYGFYNGYVWINKYEFTDLTLFEKEFKKELRFIKLKNILG